MDMDLLAKSLMYDSRQRQIISNHIGISDFDSFAVIIDIIKVTGDYVNTIHNIIQGENIMKYWNEKERFPAEKNENIDWYVVRHTRVMISFDRIVWISKQFSGLCGTGVKMKQWKYR